MKWLLRRLREFWWRTQRHADIAILWPRCKDLAPDLEHAKGAFAVHAFNDPAWIEFYGEDQLIQVIDGMT